MPKKVSPLLLIQARRAVEEHDNNFAAAAEALGIPRSTLVDRYNKALQQNLTTKDGRPKEKKRIVETSNGLTIDYLGTKIETPEDLIAHAEIDLDVWEVAEVTINNWEVAGKINQDGSQRLWKTPLRQIKVKLRKKSDERLAIESLLEKIESSSPKVPKIKRVKLNKSEARCLEVSIMDPHYGMQCYPPGADQAWSLNDCEIACMWAIYGLLERAKPYGPFEQIIFPFGNDFLHHDSLRHETTAGTPQPEAVAWHHVYERAEVLAINMIDALKTMAPVKVIEVPGNHDRHSAYTLARVLNAYYRNDENVEVDATVSPYKFHRYGTNLIGFEHGHSVAPIRLAALMANERPQDWAETSYREWHLGDQHRKGSSKPHTFEEQGVSVEYLPALTPPNEWHRIKAFNWQKRGAMAYVWDYHTGPMARVQVNLNSYTGKPTGARRLA